MNRIARLAAALHDLLRGLGMLLLFAGPVVAGVVVYVARWTIWSWLWVWPAVIVSSWVCTWLAQVAGALAIRWAPNDAAWVLRVKHSRDRAALLTPHPTPPTPPPPAS